MDLQSALLSCGFDEAEARIVVGGFLSGIANAGEALGRADQKVGEVLTEDQATEILTKSLDDCIAAMPNGTREDRSSNARTGFRLSVEHAGINPPPGSSWG